MAIDFTLLTWNKIYPLISVLQTEWKFESRLAPNEEETAAERCSEKLVDLVVLLTTKVLYITSIRFVYPS